MTEPTVQVPVSLIKRAVEGLLKAPGRDAILVCGELHTLLSQPTPIAEADEWCREENCQYRHWTSGDLGRTHKRGSGCPQRTMAPPRIEDMAPGTTFRAVLVRNQHAPGMVYTFQVTYAQPATVKYDGWESYEYVDRIDQSTIRDVTPPREER